MSAARLNPKVPRRIALGFALACVVACLTITGTLLARQPVPGTPATMDDQGLGAYICESLVQRGVPVTVVTVAGGEPDSRSAAIELQTKNAESINPDLARIMANITNTIRILVDEQGTDLDFYSVLLRDESGAELLSLQVDINRKTSHWHRDPRLRPLNAPPNILDQWNDK